MLSELSEIGLAFFFYYFFFKQKEQVICQPGSEREPTAIPLIPSLSKLCNTAGMLVYLRLYTYIKLVLSVRSW